MNKYSSLIEHYGYLIVFFGVMLGNSGIPFPSAAILLTAGIMVQQGHLEFGDAIVPDFSCSPVSPVGDALRNSPVPTFGHASPGTG